MDLETAAPYLVHPPTIKIDGKEHALRRLGMIDWFHFLDLVHLVASRGAREVRAWMGALADMPDWKERGMMIALFGLKHARPQLVQWFASLLQWEVADVEDTSKFPLGTELAIVEAFLDHPDLEDVFRRGLRLAKSGRLQAVLSKVLASQT